MKEEITILFNNNITLIDLIDKTIISLRIQNYDKALRYASIIFERLSYNLELFDNIVEVDQSDIISILNEVLQSQIKKDYVLMADLLELRLLRFLTELQEIIISEKCMTISDINNENNLKIIKQSDDALFEILKVTINLRELSGYDIEYSSSGLVTLALTDDKGKYYMHSNNRIYSVDHMLANSWYQNDIIDYVVYGFGLGYHIRELAELDPGISITVFEADINVLKLATSYTDMSYLNLETNIKIVYDPDFKFLIERISKITDNEKFVIHYPSLRNIKNSEIREKLENYFIQFSSIENQKNKLNSNFRNNILHYDNMIDELKDSFLGKDLYIVAAGPSLDKNFLQLGNLNRSNSIILATGTVYRKLLNAGIKPDYVIVTDANDRVYGQVAGLEESGIPMLFLSTANKNFALNYKAPKYMICQQDYEKSEAFAKEKNAMLFQTGGSVSTTALDIGISFGCRRIIFLGLDLAFTDNYVHAADTSQRTLSSTESLRQVEDINGNLIYTSKSLDIYRKWIENRIRDVKDIEFIDATEGGARIEGMKIMKLENCIQ